jgi:hypothetical protein
MANDTAYGLISYVCGPDKGVGMQGSWALEGRLTGVTRRPYRSRTWRRGRVLQLRVFSLSAGA